MCGYPQAPSILIVRPLGPTPWRAVSSPVWSFADRTWNLGQLRCLTAILLEMSLLFHSNNKLIPFHLGPSGHFSSGCFRAGLTAIVGASVFCLGLFSFYSSPRIFYCNILSEPAVAVFLKTDLVQTPVFGVWIAYSG